jgi:isopenicillin N synthase-like dioxygenase
MSIPVIDFSPWTKNASHDQRVAVSEKLVNACKEVGFAYLVNHGVSQDALDLAFAISKRFYSLPKEEKLRAPHPPGWAHHRGYSWPGLEKVSSVQSKEDDKELVDALRKTTDYKVILMSPTTVVPCCNC